MKRTLNEIFILESDQKFDEAFSLYKTLLKSEPLNFEYWKHYFFFLWSMLEDGIEIFYYFLQYNLIFGAKYSCVLNNKII